ncbi:hypothetical protein H0H81_011693 [Sphagnurus paluster]|uniref:Uncharacterized protein n=1 Tax=Sphagnurus paluster TaxID=117069 RepID=A0A9P7GP99_9AGAR|nr:hypothetical protein H0H81_011693 [Sphagnurus paluster]
MTNTPNYDAVWYAIAAQELESLPTAELEEIFELRVQHCLSRELEKAGDYLVALEGYATVIDASCCATRPEIAHEARRSRFRLLHALGMKSRTSTSTPAPPESESHHRHTPPWIGTPVVTSTSVGTTNGQVFTTIIEITTTLPPGTVTGAPTAVGSSGTNVGAIVGGVVGDANELYFLPTTPFPPIQLPPSLPPLTPPPPGITALLTLPLLALFLLRRHRHKRNREQDLFDGNFDPAHVVPTAPRISLLEEDNDNDNDKDNGNSNGTGGGGALPYSYIPPGDNATIATGTGTGTGTGNGTISSWTGRGTDSPELRQHDDYGLIASAGVAGAGAAGVYTHHPYGERYQPQQHQRQQYYYPEHAAYTPYPYGTMGSPYTPAPAPVPVPAPVYTSEGGTASGGSGHAYHGMALQNQSPQGMAAYGVYPGSAPGPGSVSSHGGQSVSTVTATATGTGTGSGGDGTRSAKEREAYVPLRLRSGPRSESVHGSGHGSGHGYAQERERGPIVHRDGGRVVVRGVGEDEEGAEEEDGEQMAEIPPAYDSLPHDVRR